MKRKKTLILIVVFTFLFAILCIVVGFYFRQLSKPSHIVGNVLDVIQDKSRDYFFPNKDIYIGDNFTLESSIDFDLESDYYKNKSVEDEESLKKYHFIQNLSNLDTKLTLEHDSKNRQLLQVFQQQLGEESLYYKKILVENETQYYYVDDILKQYVNNGTCNYFETIRENSTTMDNMEYLYKFFFSAFQKSLDEDDFKEYEKKTNIQGKEEKVHQISIRVTDKMVKKIWNSIVQEFEDDEEASFLVHNIIPNYTDFFLKDGTSILKNNEYYIINIYTSRFLYVPLKFEVIHMIGDEKETYIYEGNQTSGTYYYSSNDQIVYIVDMKWNSSSIQFKIKNLKGEQLGDFRFDRDGNNITANYNFENKDKKYEVIYSSKYDNMSKNKGYVNTQQMSFNISEEQISRLKGSVTFIMNKNNKVMVDETIGETILASKLSDEQNELFKNKNKSVLERLER